MWLILEDLFFLLDYLHGGTVKSAYLRLIKFEKLDSSSKEVINYQESALKNLLEHAVETSGFYSTFKGKKIVEFPVINKILSGLNKTNLYLKNIIKMIC